MQVKMVPLRFSLLFPTMDYWKYRVTKIVYENERMVYILNCMIEKSLKWIMFKEYWNSFNLLLEKIHITKFELKSDYLYRIIINRMNKNFPNPYVPIGWDELLLDYLFFQMNNRQHIFYKENILHALKVDLPSTDLTHVLFKEAKKVSKK